MVTPGSGTGKPFSINVCSRAELYFNRVCRVAPLSAMISKRSRVMADLLPNARNHTLPLTSSGMPSIHISLTRLERLTLSQLGMISFSHC